MSNHLTSLAYKLDVGSLLRKSVLVLLADKASDDGSGIWASKQTMADELCCSKQAILNTLQAFADEGLLAETGHRKTTNGYTVVYSLSIAAMEALPRVKRWADQSTTLTSQPDGPVNDNDGTSQPGLPKPPLTPRSEAKASLNKRAIPIGWWPKDFGVGTQSRKIVDSWPPGEIEMQVEQFVAHHRAKGSKFLDWQDAWSTWVLNSRKYGGSRNGQQSGIGKSAAAFAKFNFAPDETF